MRRGQRPRAPRAESGVVGDPCSARRSAVGRRRDRAAEVVVSRARASERRPARGDAEARDGATRAAPEIAAANGRGDRCAAAVASRRPSPAKPLSMRGDRSRVVGALDSRVDDGIAPERPGPGARSSRARRSTARQVACNSRPAVRRGQARHARTKRASDSNRAAPRARGDHASSSCRDGKLRSRSAAPSRRGRVGRPPGRSTGAPRERAGRARRASQRPTTRRPTGRAASPVRAGRSAVGEPSERSSDVAFRARDRVRSRAQRRAARRRRARSMPPVHADQRRRRSAGAASWVAGDTAVERRAAGCSGAGPRRCAAWRRARTRRGCARRRTASRLPPTVSAPPAARNGTSGDLEPGPRGRVRGRVAGRAAGSRWRSRGRFRGGRRTGA